MTCSRLKRLENVQNRPEICCHLVSCHERKLFMIGKLLIILYAALQRLYRVLNREIFLIVIWGLLIFLAVGTGYVLYNYFIPLVIDTHEERAVRWPHAHSGTITNSDHTAFALDYLIW